MVDPGEEPVTSAERELLEETGYEPAEIFAFGATMVPDTGRLENRMFSFFETADWQIRAMDDILGQLQPRMDAQQLGEVERWFNIGKTQMEALKKR